MHELTLIDNVLNMVRINAENSNISRVSKIKLVVGQLSMAVPESLQFAFDTIKGDDMFARSILEIEEVAIQCRCTDCGKQFVLDHAYHFCCPKCQGRSIDIVSGRELYVDYYEGDEY